MGPWAIHATKWLENNKNGHISSPTIMLTQSPLQTTNKKKKKKKKKKNLPYGTAVRPYRTKRSILCTTTTMIEESVLEDPPEVEEQEEILQPEQIVFHSIRKRGQRVIRKYLLKFKNYSPLDSKWMPEEFFKDYPQILEAYKEAVGPDILELHD